MNPHHGLDEVGLSRFAHCSRRPAHAMYCRARSIFDHAQRLAPSFVPVGNEAVFCSALIQTSRYARI